MDMTNATGAANTNMMTITADIAAATKELVIRERAASHLSGIPASQNQAAIDGLYDVLNHLHIARMEASERSISARIAAIVAAGGDSLDGLREVCGADVVDAMIDSLYHALRASAVR